MSTDTYLKPGQFVPVRYATPAERVRYATEVIESVAVEDMCMADGLNQLRFLMLNDDEATLGRAVEAWRLRDEVLGCPSQVEKYTDVSPIEGVYRAAQRFVDDQQDVIDLAVEEMTK